MNQTDSIENKDFLVQTSLSYRKKILYFIGVVFFSIHTLYYIIHFRLNFPHGDDFYIIPFSYEFAKTGQFPINEFLSSASSHLVFSLKLITLPNLLLNSFDLVNLYYFQWILMSITLFLLFLIIKRTDKRLYWTLIPISATVYCPIFITGYFIFSTIMWLSVSLGIISVVYFLTSPILKRSHIFAAISMATFSTFFNLMGTVTWVIGIIRFLKRENKSYFQKKWIVFWLGSLIINGLIVYIFAPSFSGQNKIDLFLSIDGLKFLITYLATSYRFGSENIEFSQMIGLATLVIFGYLLYYFVKEKEVERAYPWLMLITISIISGIIIAIGRMDLGYHDGNEAFYKAVSFYSQIGILVLISLIIVKIKGRKSSKSSKVKLAIFVSILVFQSIFLIPSYYASWEKGEYYHNQKLFYVDCYSLSHGSECLEKPPFHGMGLAFEKEHLEIINYWASENKGIFGEENFNSENKNDIKFFNDVVRLDSEKEIGYGKILKINEESNLQKSVIISEQYVKIEGWMMDNNHSELDSIFLIMDDEPFLKYDDFLEYTNNESSKKSKWVITFLSGYLTEGCHDISIVGIKDSKLFSMKQEVSICKNNELGF